MIELRVQQEDCNAGAIFDSLSSEHWTDEKFAVKCISEALPSQNVQVLLFNFNKEIQMNKDNQPVELDVCTNYRYSRRHDAHLANKKEEEKVAEVKEATTPKAAKNKSAKFQSSPKKPAKGQQPEANEEAILVEQEKARKKAEMEAAIKDAAEAKKDKIRPKDYSDEEKKAWRAIANSFQDFIGEIAQKQLTEKEAAPDKNWGTRSLSTINVEYNFTYLCEHICAAIVPGPIWPDPDKEPLPAPIISSILKKPPNRAERNKITKFQIFTPTGPSENDQLPPMTDQVTRWVLGPKESKKLYIKFFSTKIGSYSETLQFEIIGSYKAFNLPITGLCEFP